MDPALRLVDAHCHPLETPDELHTVAGLRVARLAVCSAREEEWAPMLALRQAHGSRVMPGFGVHPWFAHRASPGWLERLEDHLRRTPDAFVGEIGLDRVAVTPDTQRNEFAAQQPVFVAQLRLAHQLQRPVSVHAVHCWGVLCELLAAPATLLPPRIMLHSFGGAVAMVASLLALERKRSSDTRFYFSFSSTINGRAPKTAAVIAAVPADRLLIESDEHSARHMDAALAAAVRLVAEARGCSVAEAAALTTRNAELFFQ